MNSNTAKDKWQRRLVRSGYFFGAVLLHLIAIVMLATWIIFRAPEVQSDATFVQTNVRPPPPPAPPPPAGGDSVSSLEPSVQVAPPPVAISVVTTAAPSNFAIKSVNVKIPNLPSTFTPPAGSGLSGSGAPGEGSGAGSPFGTSESSGNPMMVGFLYDIKQTRDGQPTGLDPGAYEKKVLEFINSDWDPGVLRDFYKSPKPLNTTSIFIPIIKSEDGPKAFGVENEVKPNEYVVWYKVKAAPPEEGTYRFVGTADDILFIRVNHKTVLDGTDYGIDKELRSQEKSFQMTNFHGTFPNNENFWISLPFQASPSEPVDIDILIGEQPGGHSDYFVFIQKDDKDYPKQSNESPLLPIFQLDAKRVVPKGEPMTFPPFGDPEPWTAVAPDNATDNP